MCQKLLVLLFVSLVSSCSSLKVHKFKDANTSPRAGFVYFLSFTTYKIEVTRSIANCETAKMIDVVAKDKDKKGFFIKTSKTAKVKIPDVKSHMKVEINTELVDDGNQVYVVDSESLNGFTKVSELSLKWEEGRLVSVNSSAADKSASLAKSVISGVAKIAISSISPIPAVTSTTDTGSPVIAASNTGSETKIKSLPIVKCNATTIKALETVRLMKVQIESHTESITTFTKRIIDLEAELKKLGVQNSLDCTNSGNAANPKCKLIVAMDELKAIQKELSKATSQMKKAFALISHKETYFWPETSEIQQSGRHSLQNHVLEKWASIAETDLLEEVQIHQQDLANFKKTFDVYFNLSKMGSYGKDILPITETENEPAEAGFRYRVPANGYLLVCKKTDCKRDEVTQRIGIHKGPIHQLGYVFNIPFTSKPFTAGSLALVFDKQSRLKEGKVTQTESSAENLATVIDTFSDKVVEYKTAKAASEVVNPEIEALKEQTELINAQKALADAQKGLNPSITPLQELQDMTLLAEQQKKYLDALAALEPSLPEPTEENAEEIATIEAETLLILSKVAQLEAKIALKEASKTLSSSNSR